MKIQVLKDGPVVEVDEDVANAFCPTGKGGGVDPSCGSGKGGSGGGSVQGGFGEKFPVGSKVSFGGGIFKGKKAKVVEVTDTGVVVKFNDFKLYGRKQIGGKFLIEPRSSLSDKPTMTTIEDMFTQR